MWENRARTRLRQTEKSNANLRLFLKKTFDFSALPVNSIRFAFQSDSSQFGTCIPVEKKVSNNKSRQVIVVLKCYDQYPLRLVTLVFTSKSQDISSKFARKSQRNLHTVDTTHHFLIFSSERNKRSCCTFCKTQDSYARHFPWGTMDKKKEVDNETTFNGSCRFCCFLEKGRAQFPSGEKNRACNKARIGEQGDFAGKKRTNTRKKCVQAWRDIEKVPRISSSTTLRTKYDKAIFFQRLWENNFSNLYLSLFVPISDFVSEKIGLKTVFLEIYG